MWTHAYLVNEFQGVGDAAEGWVNAILYIFASAELRKRLFRNITIKKPSIVTSVQYHTHKRSTPFETASITLMHTGIGAASDNDS